MQNLEWDLSKLFSGPDDRRIEEILCRVDGAEFTALLNTLRDPVSVEALGNVSKEIEDVLAEIYSVNIYGHLCAALTSMSQKVEVGLLNERVAASYERLSRKVIPVFQRMREVLAKRDSQTLKGKTSYWTLFSDLKLVNQVSCTANPSLTQEMIAEWKHYLRLRDAIAVTSSTAPGATLSYSEALNVKITGTQNQGDEIDLQLAEWSKSNDSALQRIYSYQMRGALQNINGSLREPWRWPHHRPALPRRPLMLSPRLSKLRSEIQRFQQSSYASRAGQSSDELSYEPNEAVDLVVEFMSTFRPEWGRAVGELAGLGRVSTGEQRGAAFRCVGVPGDRPFVSAELSPFSPQALTNLAHELGHAVHKMRRNPLGFIAGRVSTVEAETVAIFFEALFARWMIKHPSQKLSRRFRDGMVEALMNSLLVFQTNALFEWLVYETLSSEPEPPPGRFAELYEKALRDGLAPGEPLAPHRRHMWSLQTLIFLAPFQIAEYPRAALRAFLLIDALDTGRISTEQIEQALDGRIEAQGMGTFESLLSLPVDDQTIVARGEECLQKFLKDLGIVMQEGVEKHVD